MVQVSIPYTSKMQTKKEGMFPICKKLPSFCILFIYCFTRSYLQGFSPGCPHGTNASLIIGSEQLPLYSKKARNVYLFVRANTN